MSQEVRRLTVETGVVLSPQQLHVWLCCCFELEGHKKLLSASFVDCVTESHRVVLVS